MVTYADLIPSQRKQLSSLKKGQQKQYLGAYSNLYDSFGIKNFTEAQDLQNRDPTAYESFRSGSKSIMQGVGKQISANKPKGMFGGGILGKVASFALPAVGFAIGGPAGAALASGVSTKLSGGSLKDALLSAGLSYAGGSIGNKLLPTSIGAALSPKNALGPYTLSSSLGSVAANSLGNQIANTSIGSVAGGFFGNSIGDALRTPKMAQDNFISGINQNRDFTPSREAKLDLPGSLGGFAGLSPDQQSTGIATQGVYGSGAGPGEQAYFTNLINRRLTDETGKQDSDLSEINPVENSYLAQLGLGGYSNPRDLLEAMSKWKQAA